jgi:histidine triad (HIT) family protein
MSTIFKKIIDGEIPAERIYEDDLCLAFRDVAPQAPHHYLLIPKKEIASLAAVTPADKALLGHLLVVASQIARQNGLEKQGYRLVVNTGENGGQTVFHLHFHLLGGRKLAWPPG